ncbi:MAG: hypothetical protein JKX84_02515 [Flavobacteriales bacterium]|nr:hypothetical protein [Flavobacteriales bacterium]
MVKKGQNERKLRSVFCVFTLVKTELTIFIAVDNLIKHAQHFLKYELLKRGLSAKEDGVGDFRFKSETGQTHATTVKVLNLETAERSVKIPKSIWNYDLPKNTWVALVLFVRENEPWAYLIPAKVFEKPNRVFIGNDQGERMKHFSTWEIKVFGDGMKELSEFALANSVKELV